VYYEDLEISVRRFRQRVHTASQKLELVPGWYYNRDVRPSVGKALGKEAAGAGRRPSWKVHPCLDSPPSERLLDSHLPGLRAARLGPAAPRRRGRVCPEMIEHLGDVPDALCHFGCPQRKVMILGTVKGASKAANAEEYVFSDHQKVTQVHERQE